MTHLTAYRGSGRRAQLLVTVTALLAGLALTGCSGTTPWSNNASAASRSAELIQEAKDAGASEAQLAALSDGKVTFTEYKDATHASLDCLRAAGIAVDGDDEVDTTGRLQYGYAVPAPGLTEAQTEAVADECFATHSEFADRAYQAALFD